MFEELSLLTTIKLPLVSYAATIELEESCEFSANWLEMLELPCIFSSFLHSFFSLDGLSEDSDFEVLVPEVVTVAVSLSLRFNDKKRFFKYCGSWLGNR